MTLSLENQAVQAYVLYAALCAVKMLAMATMTGTMRLLRGAFANPEDAKRLGGKVKFDDPVVERIRRAHLNDLENIPAFWILGALYLTTGPAVAWATLLFRAFTLARYVHTFVYAIVPMPQPSRGIAFGVAFLVNIYMAVQVILYYVASL